MKILVACEYSGRVREAFRKKGHNAISVDLRHTEQEGPHHQGRVEDLLEEDWDMMIAFPPCTYLSISGLHRNLDNPVRERKTEEALKFFKMLHQRPIKKIVMENPMGCVSSRYQKYSQIIHPYMFGDDASKRTCLWLKGVPKLVPTQYVKPRMVNGKPRWGNQLDSGQCGLSGKDRAKERAKTYQGIADAMANQWG
jgi:site-specific DNA-cytosine methylase